MKSKAVPEPKKNAAVEPEDVERMHMLQHIVMRGQLLSEEETAYMKNCFAEVIAASGKTAEELDLMAAVCSIDCVDFDRIYQSAEYIHSFLEEFCLEKKVSLLFWDRGNLLAIGWIADDTNLDVKIASFRTNWIRLNMQLRKTHKSSVTAVLSRKGKLNELPLLFEECRALMKHRLYMGNGSFIDSGMIRIRDQEPVKLQRLEPDYLKKLIKRGDRKSIREYIDDRYMDLIIAQVTSEDLVRSFSEQLKGLLMLSLNEGGYDPVRHAFAGSGIMEDIPQLHTITEYKDWVLEYYDSVLQNIGTRTGKKCSQVISRAASYIDANYTSELTLEMMARRAGRSPNYFCQLFKKEIGVSFVEYLNGVRIEKAKELLDNTDSMEYVIAVRVGYKEGKYFSVIFKKMTGMSPRQYRNRVSKDADHQKERQVRGGNYGRRIEQSERTPQCPALQTGSDSGGHGEEGG